MRIRLNNDQLKYLTKYEILKDISNSDYLIIKYRNDLSVLDILEKHSAKITERCLDVLLKAGFDKNYDPNAIGHLSNYFMDELTEQIID